MPLLNNKAIIIPITRNQQTCMSCEEGFTGPEPKMCCDGRDCGCMGQPVEPVVCSQECYDKIMNDKKGGEGV